MLCFPSLDALRVALARGRLGIRTFEIEGRPGRFAITSEVAQFVADQYGATSVPPLTPVEYPKGSDSN